MAGPWRKDPRGAVFFGGHLAVFDGPDGGKWFSYGRAPPGGYLPIEPYTVTASAYDGPTKVAEATSSAGPPLDTEVAKQLVDFYHSKSRRFSQTLDLPVPNARLWSTDTPFLYDLKVELTA
jgi:hypothetical protein